MKKFYSLILALMSLSNLSRAFDNLEFTTSQVHGLVGFVETLSGNPHRSRSLKEAFEKSKYNTPEVAHRIAEFRDLVSDLDQTIEFPGYPEDRHMGINISQIFLIRSAYSKNLEDFRQRTVGLVPIPMQARYFELMKYFSPIYQELVWKPGRTKLNHHISELKTLGNKSGISEMFEKAKVFYRSEWPTETKFRLTLFPIPGAKGSAKSESLLAFESIGVLVDSKDHAQKFSVIFHEMCHSLYESQSKEFQKTFQNYFTQSKSPYARYTYHLMNEGLATALGNGWAFKRATGKMNEGSWYNHRYIEQYAKALYPFVESYVSHGKPIDQPFAEGAIEIFAKTFPEAPEDLENLLTHVSLSVDEEAIPVNTAARMLHENFSVWSMKSTALTNKEKITGDFDKESNTSVVLLTPTRIEPLKNLPMAILTALGEPARLLKDGKDKIITGTTDQGNVFLIIVSSSEQGFEKALRILKEKKRIEPKLSTLFLENPS